MNETRTGRMTDRNERSAFKGQSSSERTSDGRRRTAQRHPKTNVEHTQKREAKDRRKQKQNVSFRDRRRDYAILTPMRVKKNVVIIFSIFFLVAILVFVNIGITMAKHGDDYRRQVIQDVSYVSKSTKYKRGNITDRNGNVLAESKRVYDMILDPHVLIADVDENNKYDYYDGTVKLLGEVFNMKEEQVKEAIAEDKNSQYYPMEKYKGLSLAKKKKFEQKKKEINESEELIKKYGSMIGGVSFDERFERYYPYKTVGADLIGIASTDNVGAFGLEASYNEDLNGENGKKYRYYKSNLEYEESSREAIDGNNVVSTIDVNVQGVVEQHIARFSDDMGARNIGVILMNPNNGEILAMASEPTYDLNNPADFGFNLNKFLKQHFTQAQISKFNDSAKLSAVWKSFCISDEYEPGSTFKPFSVAACLDEAVVNNNSSFVCDGGQDVSGVYIRCSAHNYGGHGQVDLEHAVMYSCNDALMQMCASMGYDKFIKYCSDFGFGKTTGIDISGEATGQVFNKDTLGPVELATSSFGQGQTVTMIQMAAGFSSLVNGGTYYKPHLMKEIVNDNGAVLRSYADIAERRTITQKSSDLLCKYLFSTVEEGTAKPAAVSGYEVCGKTGTAEKHPTGLGNYLVSFIGCVPSKNPELVCYVVIDEPDTQDQAHSTYATEFASSLLKDVLPILGIKPTREKTDESNSSVKLPSTSKGNLYDGAPEGGYADQSYNVAKSNKNKKNNVSSDIIVPEEIEGIEDTSADETVGAEGVTDSTTVTATESSVETNIQ